MEGGAGVGVGGVGSLTMDCEDMFKEITKKLYGEEAVGVGVGVGVGRFRRGVSRRRPRSGRRAAPRGAHHGLGARGAHAERLPAARHPTGNFSPRIDTTAEDRWTAARSRWRGRTRAWPPTTRRSASSSAPTASASASWRASPSTGWARTRRYQCAAIGRVPTPPQGAQLLPTKTMPISLLWLYS
ncbi:hypothetical protein ACJJTC_000430 [Scirpophaga incertulas]